MFDVLQWQKLQHDVAPWRALRDVQVVAVSKGQSVASMRQAWDAGVRHLGESYVQEALDKQRELSDLALTWHFIGRIQSNKARPIAEHFDWVHGVTNLAQAERLARAREATGRAPLSVCLQVNLSGEGSKGGMAAQDVEAHLPSMLLLRGMVVRGLMTLPEPVATQGEAQIRQRFRTLRQLAEALRASGFAIDTLSMGMSNDYRIALEEGATLLRVGTRLFGTRESQ